MAPHRGILTFLSALSLAVAGVAGSGPAASAASIPGTSVPASTAPETPIPTISTAADRWIGPTHHSPGRYLLSLGDSLSFGYQARKIDTELATGSYSPDHFPGYVQPFETEIRSRTGRSQTAVNYSCPGETTFSMINGPCAFAGEVHRLGYAHALHDDYDGSQLTAATTFLRAHPGQVSPITLSIGANDLNDLLEDCDRNPACVQRKLPATLATLGRNLSGMLTTLRTAAPRARIIVLTPYNPYSALAPGTDTLLIAANTVIAGVALIHLARVADGFTTINLAIPGHELTSLCTFTLMCTDSDIHPSDAGYQRLADTFWRVSGYRRCPVRGAA